MVDNTRKWGVKIVCPACGRSVWLHRAEVCLTPGCRQVLTMPPDRGAGRKNS